MKEKTLEIIAFIKKHYTPGTLVDIKTELQLSLSGILNSLFEVFPSGCMDKYGLHNLLTTLGYKPQKKGVASFVWYLKKNE